jgi:hypothetical protein
MDTKYMDCALTLLRKKGSCKRGRALLSDEMRVMRRHGISCGKQTRIVDHVYVFFLIYRMAPLAARSVRDSSLLSR